MRKLVFAIVALSALSLSSCKKAWICSCTYDNGFTGDTDERHYAIEETTKKDGEKLCDEFYKYNLEDNYDDVECEIQ